MKTLVAGWFSFEDMGATAGDLFCRDLACEWLNRGGHSYDVALATPFKGGVDWRSVDPESYTQLLFVCGPFGNGPPVVEFLERFRGLRLIGLSLSMLEPLTDWNPFDLLLERDSSRTSRPDISFLAKARRVPVVGVVLIDSQPEYRGKDAHRFVNDAVQRLIDSREMSVVYIDTRLDRNRWGLRSAPEIESLIARMDVVVTTRMHGMVLALKNGVPAVAIDSVSGGAKILRQARTIGWPEVVEVDDLTDEALREAFDRCLTEPVHEEARACGERAKKVIESVRAEFVRSLSALGGGET
jgi:hypothetical protein